jgi:hypothetical protein
VKAEVVVHGLTRQTQRASTCNKLNAYELSASHVKAVQLLGLVYLIDKGNENIRLTKYTVIKGKRPIKDMKEYIEFQVKNG